MVDDKLLITLDEFFIGQEDSRRIFDTLRRMIGFLGPVTMRISKSQIAFARRKTFAWVWMPGRYLRVKHAPLVLTLAMQRHDPSTRWKEIVEPNPGRFTHHLELNAPGDIDAQVYNWLQEAWTDAA